MNSNRGIIASAMALLALSLLAVRAQAAVINVPADQATIQAAIDAAVTGDEVVVAIGTYSENINFNGKAITVRSSDPTNLQIVHDTIIDGGAAGTVVNFSSGEGPSTALSGFTITNGHATLAGGIRASSASPTITYCNIRNNVADVLGGGALVSSGGNPHFAWCTFQENSALGGGGIDDDGSSPMLTDCTFVGNVALNNPGGAMALSNNAQPVLTRCHFIANSAQTTGTGTANGGAMSCINSSPTLIDCSFDANSAAQNGGAISFSAGNSTVTGCQFRGNTATNAGGAIHLSGASLSLGDSAFCFNAPTAIVGTYVDNGGNLMDSCQTQPPPPPVLGDMNGDGIVNGDDIAAFVAALLS